MIKDSNTLVNSLIHYAREKLYLSNIDEIHLRNRLLAKFKLEEYFPSDEKVNKLDELITSIEQIALHEKLVEEGELETFTTAIMDMISPLPSFVQTTFFDLLHHNSSEEACRFLFNLQVDNDYIKLSKIKLNLFWKANFPNNYLEITINLSKPEKDNKVTAKLAREVSSKYPKCILCYENLGYAGRHDSPPRQNIRLVDFKLGDEDWFMQYSPYQYYEEHVVVIHKKHVNMKIDEQTFIKLCDFVDLFPNYFVGSNASLPIVGGSILNHEHFQGGKHLMPIFASASKYELRKKGYEDCKISYLDWYNSCLKITSSNRDKIIAFASEILTVWNKYRDEEIDLIPYTKEQHNAITPIIRKVNHEYQLYIVLRNNRTNEEHPDGIFHAHRPFHNIKKESIGLIEAMGLFILPGRLKRQFTVIEDILMGKVSQEEAIKLHPDIIIHQEMINTLQKEYGIHNSKQQIKSILEQYINNTCRQILECTAIFKNTPMGDQHFRKFLQAVDLEIIGG